VEGKNVRPRRNPHRPTAMTERSPQSSRRIAEKQKNSLAETSTKTEKAF
jgi:hypothetical protein